MKLVDARCRCFRVLTLCLRCLQRDVPSPASLIPGSVLSVLFSPFVKPAPTAIHVGSDIKWGRPAMSNSVAFFSSAVRGIPLSCLDGQRRIIVHHACLLRSSLCTSFLLLQELAHGNCFLQQQHDFHFHFHFNFSFSIDIDFNFNININININSKVTLHFHIQSHFNINIEFAFA